MQIHLHNISSRLLQQMWARFSLTPNFPTLATELQFYTYCKHSRSFPYLSHRAPDMRVYWGKFKDNLFLNRKVCCDLSLELSQQDGSNEGSQDMYYHDYGKIWKNYPCCPFLPGALFMSIPAGHLNAIGFMASQLHPKVGKKAGNTHISQDGGKYW